MVHVHFKIFVHQYLSGPGIGGIRVFGKEFLNGFFPFFFISVKIQNPLIEQVTVARQPPDSLQGSIVIAHESAKKEGVAERWLVHSGGGERAVNGCFGFVELTSIEIFPGHVA